MLVITVAVQIGFVVGALVLSTTRIASEKLKSVGAPALTNRRREPPGRRFLAWGV